MGHCEGGIRPGIELSGEGGYLSLYMKGRDGPVPTHVHYVSQRVSFHIHPKRVVSYEDRNGREIQRWKNTSDTHIPRSWSYRQN